jgi:lysophospholipase L1-like esterase
LNALLLRLLFWAMLPVTALQGLWLRRRATRLPGAVGARSGVTGDGADFHLLAVGDSIIDGVGAGCRDASLPVQFANALAARSGRRVHWRVEGASGYDIRDVLALLDGLSWAAPLDLVLLSVGVNDVTGLSSTRHWRRNLVALLTRIRERWPAAEVVFAGLPPMASFPLPPQPLRFALGLRAATLDRIAREVVSGFPGAAHIPTRIDPRRHNFCEDGFHPSADSCTVWATELATQQPRSTIS